MRWTWVLVLFLAWRQLSLYWTEVPITTTDEAMPLVTTRDGVLAEQELLHLRDDALALVPEGLQLLSRNFDNTRGFVLKFNREGAAKLRDPSFEGGKWSPLLRFFDLVDVDAQSNAFVLNLLIVPPAKNESTTAAVGVHLDNTVCEPPTPALAGQPQRFARMR